jgi:hypothetical protein
VVPFKKPQLYLVGIFHINHQDKNNILVHKYNIGTFERELFKYTTVKFPQLYSWNTYNDLINSYASMNTSYDVLGVVIYNSETGERTKIRNPVYEQVKSLRGNQPKLQYQYISLRKEGKVKAFLDYYPENKKEFSQFRDQIHVFTNTLYMNYVSCYIKKERPLADFSQQYKTHMYHIHQIFMNELREKKLFVTNMVVIHYVNQLTPSLLMYCLNFYMRKRNVDFIKNDTL